MRKKTILSSAITLLAIAVVAGPFWTARVVRSVEIANKRTRLPAPRIDGATSVEKALHDRRSVRDFKKQPMELAEISQLLWSAQGITGSGGLRTAPSAGALYPLEIYLVAGNVERLPQGVYKYRPDGHELIRTLEIDKRAELSQAALDQVALRNAAAILLVAADYERTTAKYGNKGIRYVHIETGHVGQSVCLQAVALNLGAVVIGAFDDARVKSIAKLLPKEEPLYLIPVGNKR